MKKSKSLMSETIKIELVRLQLERERLELDKRRTSIKEKRASRKLWIWLVGTLGAALLVACMSIAGVYVSKYYNERDIAISNAQKQIELEKLEIQRQRENGLNTAQFVMANKET